MMVGGVFGCFITRQGLEELRRYEYRGGGSTPIDRLMNPWWDYVAGKLPLWLSPNLLTVFGFGCTLLCMLLVMSWMPHLREAAPRWVYFAMCLLLFVYQTLDAVDGKQARRTNSSTPLGQLFDHGCDSFSTVFAVFINAATARMGVCMFSYVLLAILQMQMFIYSWWEIHFHVYRCHTGVTGVTEGQLVTMGVNLLGAIFGPDIFLLTFGQCLALTYSPAAAFFPDCLLNTPMQYIISFPFYLLLTYMLVSDIFNGCRLVNDKALAIPQLIGCFSHVLFQFAFFCSGLMQTHPAVCYSLIIINSSIVVLRMNIAATCRLRFYPVQWPALPFYATSLYFYLACPNPSSPLAAVLSSPLSEAQQAYQQKHVIPWVLTAVSLWSVFYLYDFLLSTITAICSHLDITCFCVNAKEEKGKGRDRGPSAGSPKLEGLQGDSPVAARGGTSPMQTRRRAQAAVNAQELNALKKSS
ncbi:CDP-alcohol phosphatidyltransferase superfamily protein [Toxoplasma gondii TgCatPRC2]|uniref:CDP-alcohol phosphatidyltransferase superfamily protein n=1 Tax=Toxoplasma gondii TgCatPRC2 TaxID=1130821 RepID=A0A151H0M0_TOXGO|nr:CDP-alcohol phosphatidyltransferase superfamily protein [Toxoplasma gondii TgCatPRC2]